MNKVKVDPSEFKYATMYDRFISEKTPSLCATGKFDVTNIYKIYKKGHKFNALMCYCIMQAAQKVEVFHYSIKDDGLYYYENVKSNAVINGVDGQLYYVDYKYHDNFKDFEEEYIKANEYCSKNCCPKMCPRDQG